MIPVVPRMVAGMTVVPSLQPRMSIRMLAEVESGGGVPSRKEQLVESADIPLLFCKPGCRVYSYIVQAWIDQQLCATAMHHEYPSQSCPLHACGRVEKAEKGRRF